MKIKTLGVDLAKSVFHVYGVDGRRKERLKKRLSREKLLDFMANLSPCLAGMEACGGAHYWAREFRALGHDVCLQPLLSFTKDYRAKRDGSIYVPLRANKEGLKTSLY